MTENKHQRCSCFFLNRCSSACWNTSSCLDAMVKKGRAPLRSRHIQLIEPLKTRRPRRLSARGCHRSNRRQSRCNPVHGVTGQGHVIAHMDYKQDFCAPAALDSRQWLVRRAITLPAPLPRTPCCPRHNCSLRKQLPRSPQRPRLVAQITNKLHR